MAKQIRGKKNNKRGFKFTNNIKGKEFFDTLKPKLKKYSGVLVSLVCLMAMLLDTSMDALTVLTQSKVALAYNSNYERVADPNTMDDYLEVFNLAENSRVAGRVWSDKTVFANGYDRSKSFDGNTLTLDIDTDGVNGTVRSNTDFLHVFSTIGSSQVVDEVATKPLDVVLLLDISGSMTQFNNMNNDPLHQVLNDANTLINRLMNKDENYPVHNNNRVGVVVYGAGAQEVLPIGHYTSKTSNGTYIRIQGTSRKGTGSTYFSSIASNVSEIPRDTTTNYMRADSTYLQGALYRGMQMLANQTGTEERTPVLIVLTDGATNIISATRTSAGGASSYNWWEPSLGNNGVLPTAGDGLDYSPNAANPFYADCNGSTGNPTAASGRFGPENKNIEIQAIAPRTVSNLLLAGYYQNKIEKNYNTEMLGFSIGFNLNGADGDSNLGVYANEQLMATLDPKTYFGERTDVTELAQAEIDASRTTIQNYISKQEPQMRFPRANNQEYYFVGNGHAEFTWRHPSDFENDLESFDDVYYIDKYYVANNDELSGIFDQIFEQITGTTFSPVAGENASGVSDSLTYMDPIGEYMELKDKSIILTDGKEYDLGLTLFGEMHGLVKSAIYDFQWNDKYMKNLNEGVGGQLFSAGWYKGTPELTNEPHGNDSVTFGGKDAVPNQGDYGPNDVAKAWADGWVYRVPWSIAVQYVSTLSAENFESITDTQKNTVYTIYRFDRNITRGIDEDSTYRNIPRTNPCYEKSADVTYLLSDIRVWLEDTGNYQVTGDGSMIDAGFDQALYVNVPANALPLQVAKISLDAEGNVSKYETNVNQKTQSTPFRLYYGVGVQDAIMTEDGLDIDVPRLDNEYIKEHTQPTADGTGSEIYFLSNYYSNTVYTGYVTSGRDSYTRGDPNFTFSPSTSNRYYAFQQPLILYKYDGTPPVDNLNHYEEKVLDSEEVYQAFLESNKGKEVKTTDEISRDNYYWIVGEYYTSDNKVVHLAVTRKGGEFGSQIAGEDVSYSDYLVWYDPNTNTTQKFDRNTPGPGGDYVVATKVGGLRIGNMLNGRLQKSDNTTSTSYNYYIPTISTQSTGNNIIINGYLGNNGKLVIPNTTLEITKEVNSISGNDYSNEEFNYILQIDGRVGDFSAVNMIRSPFAENLWQLRLNTIDVLTSNEGLLQQVVETDGSGHSHSLYKRTISGIDYYVYVGGDGSDALEGIAMDGLESEDDLYSFRLYDANDTNYENLEGVGRTNYVTNPGDYTSTDKIKYVEATREKPAGTMEFWIEDAYLIPASLVDQGDWHFELPNSYSKVGSPIVISTLDPYEHGKDQLTSIFATDSMYGTTTLYFGYGEVPVGIERPEGMSDADWAWLTAPENKNKTKFTLRDGEGIFLAGLDERTNYTVYEMITEDQMANGYNFGRVYGSNGQDLEYENPNTGVYTESDFYRGSKDVHFVNTYRAHYDLILDKTVLGTYGDLDKDWNFTIKLTPVEGEELETTFYYYGKCETIDDACIAKGKQAITFTEQDGSYIGNISLKHSEKIKLINIPSNTTYEITEQEANQDDYETYEKTLEGYNPSTGTFDSDKQVGFFNANWQKHDLTIRKTVTGNWGETDKEFTFTITLTPGENARLASEYHYDGTKSGTMTFAPQEDGTYKGTITLKDGEYITLRDIPEGTKYQVLEQEANLDGYITTQPQNYQGTLEGNEQIEVHYVNTKYSRHELTLEKIVEGGRGETDKDWTFEITLTPASDVTLDETYPYVGKSIIEGVASPQNGEITFTRQEDGSYKGTVTLKHGQSITIQNIPERTEYAVVEQEANLEDYTTKDSGNTNGIVDGQTVRYTNTKLALIGLTIEKEVTGEGANTDLEWEFEITLTPASDVKLESTYPYVGKSTAQGVEAPQGGTLTLTDNHNGTYTGKVTLKHGQAITVQNLPETTKYSVTEVKANSDGYFTQTSDNRTGILDREDITVHFTNELLPPKSLTIAKEVISEEEADLNRDWTFQIKLTPNADSEFNPTYSYVGRTTITGVTPIDNGTITFTLQEDGTYLATITLKHGQAITILNLLPGTTYEVSEVEANQDDFTTTTNRTTSGTIEEDSVALIIVFTNRKTVYYDLTLSKKVIGALGDQNREWDFVIRLTPSEYAVIDDTYNYDGTKSGILRFTRQDDGSYTATIRLKHNDEITIRDIPENTSYEIVETEANTDGYLTRVIGNIEGIITQDTTVVYQNIKLGSYDLTVKKHVKGLLGEYTRDFTFKITLTAPEYVDLASSYEGIKVTVLFEGGNQTTQEVPYTLQLNKNAQGNYEGFVTLKDGETFTVRDIPEGTTYLVTEIEANQDDYITTYSNNTSGTILSDGTVVEYTNYRYRAVNLTLEKLLRGNDVESDRDWTFEITLKSSEELPLDGIFPYRKNNGEEGSIEFVKDLDGLYKGVVLLRGGERIIIKNLPYEIEYAVLEVEANKERYKTTVTNESGQLTAEQTEVTFVNERDVPNPSTGDVLETYVTLFTLSTLGIAGTYALRDKKKNN